MVSMSFKYQLTTNCLVKPMSSIQKYPLYRKALVKISFLLKIKTNVDGQNPNSFLRSTLCH